MFWRLLRYAERNGYEVVIHWVKRDLATQERLFKEGKSECDGTVKPSAHQSGKAGDLYIIESGKVSEDRGKYKVLHDEWERLGGKPMIWWDVFHFE